MLIYVNEFSGYSAQTNMEPEWARAERLGKQSPTRPI